MPKEMFLGTYLTSSVAKGDHFYYPEAVLTLDNLLKGLNHCSDRHDNCDACNQKLLCVSHYDKIIDSDFISMS